MSKRCDVSELVGKTLVSLEGMKVDSEHITFRCTDGSEYVMYHDQECCEEVMLNDVVGDPERLIGAPLSIAEEVTSAVSHGALGEWDESYTWTFYKFATVHGWVDLRWYGTSNGYYSEEVNFKCITELGGENES